MKVVSLFSGIGAFEQALRNLDIDYELVNYCEIDKFASKSYAAIHGVDESLNLGDITQINIKELPVNIDLLTHGSPCQDFSVAGKGRGADGGTRSSLMWNSVEIIRHCLPKVVIWENVKNVISKKHKHNFDKYITELENLGYTNYYQVLNAKNYGIPQNRERIFVVSVLDGREFKFPEPFENGIKLKDLLEHDVDEKYYISYEKYLKIINSKFNQERTRVQEDICRTLLATDFCSTKCVKIHNEGAFRVRKLTPLEYWRLMGFDNEDFYKAQNAGISNTQLYKQAGNSIVVNVLMEIYKNLFF